jgi:hypothetical protein
VIAAVAQCRFSLAGKVRICSTNASIRFSSMRAKKLSRSSATFLEEMFGIMRPGWSSDIHAPNLQNSAENIALHEKFAVGKVSQAAGSCLQHRRKFPVANEERFRTASGGPVRTIVEDREPEARGQLGWLSGTQAAIPREWSS